MIKYSILLLFLRENYTDIFVEMCNVYSETMAKVYYFNLKTYVNSMNKLLVDVYSKDDILFSDVASKMRAKFKRKVPGFK